MFENNLDDSGNNTAKSALSSVVSFSANDSVCTGKHPLIKRFMRGVFNLCPSVPRYTETLMLGWGSLEFFGHDCVTSNENAQKIKIIIQNFFRALSKSIRDLRKIIGLLVASFHYCMESFSNDTWKMKNI